MRARVAHVLGAGAVSHDGGMFLSGAASPTVSAMTHEDIAAALSDLFADADEVLFARAVDAVVEVLGLDSH